MESLPPDSQNKLIFDINDSEKKSSNLYTENKYCPHILGHYLNPSLNSVALIPVLFSTLVINSQA